MPLEQEAEYIEELVVEGKPNLPLLHDLTAEELKYQLSSLDRNFLVRTKTPLLPLDNKGYTARAEFSVKYQGEVFGSGTAVALLFNLNDGTGSNINFQHAAISPHWTPRRKEGLTELFIPIGTAYHQRWHRGLTNVRAVSLNPETYATDQEPLQQYAEFTTLAQQFKQGLLSKITYATYEPSRLGFTFDHATNYGNPHAIICTFKEQEAEGLDLSCPHFFQLAAFVAFPQASNGFALVQKKLFMDIL